MRMQLTAPDRPSPLRGQLRAAVGTLLALGAPAVAQADGGGQTQFDGTVLFYGEEHRANVVEPTARLTRILPDGRSFWAQLGIDVITGASPTGALPSGQVQTTTTPSGSVTSSPAGQTPTSPFKDRRIALDGGWTQPFLGRVTSALDGHFSREKDYQSLGANEKVLVDLMQKLVTVTAGAGFNHDGVFPVGGTPYGLTDGTALMNAGSNPKRVTSGMIGLSRIVTRRWMIGVNATRTVEQGYLTEPYKLVSLVDPVLGSPVGALTEKRPSYRDRRDVMASTVYHLAKDVIYASYRYYWDGWKVRSNTYDFKYRYELEDGSFFEPHVRYYQQTAASFFTWGLVNAAPLPEFASADYRLGAMSTLTVGATYGFHSQTYPGEWRVRVEYMGQSGNGHPDSAIGVERQLDLFPRVNIVSAVVAYTVDF